MTTDEEVKDAERSLLVTILTNKAIMTALITLILTAIVAATYWLGSRSGDGTLTAPSTKCTKSQCDTALASKFANASRGVCACCAIFYGTSCVPQPTPSPTPTPVPVVDAGPSPSPTVQFPACNPPGVMQAPRPNKIEEYRRTLRPRHRVTGGAMLFGSDTRSVASAMWSSNDPWCGNQGNLGACEAFTQLDIATSKPRTTSFATQAAFNAAAIAAYSWITANDPFPGAYPPNDTGSDSLSGCKWLVKQGLAKSCTVLSGAAAVKGAIQVGPVIVGMNWLENMFTPDRCGNLSITGAVAGGHAEAIQGYDVVADTWYIQNHWDNDWGICLGTHCGYHVLTSAQLFGSALDADFVKPEL